VVGLKPSRGGISRRDLATGSLTTSGGLTRDVRDAAGLLDALQGGRAALDRRKYDGSWPLSTSLEGESPRLRIGVSFGDREVQPAIRLATLTVAERLAARGHVLDEFDLGVRWATLIEDSLPYIQGVREVANEVRGMSDLESMDPLVKRLVMHSSSREDNADQGAEARLAELARSVLSKTAEIDVLLTPTTACGPPRIGEHADLPIPELLMTWESFVPFTGMWNWTGQPAISVPAGLDEEGMPIGIQLVGRPNAEATILGLADEVEQDMGLLTCTFDVDPEGDRQHHSVASAS